MPYTKSAESPQVAARVNASKSATRTPVNNLRLSDIGKLIEGRHGFICTDREWARRYFFAALPHLIVSRTRWLDAVRDWVCAYSAILLVEHGGDWIDEQARRCHAKSRKTPRQDKLCRLLAVQADEIDAYGLETLTAANESAKARDEKDRARRKKYRQDKRAADPNHTPRSQSKAAKARSDGTTYDAIYAKNRRERIKAEAAGNGDAQQHVTTNDGVSAPTENKISRPIAQQHVTETTGFRPPQYRSCRDGVSAPTTKNHTHQSEHP
ncbi:hypothetical protein [Methylobacterium sp. SD21]|uniref:hypothetical protein n=1 Tax=Methylobacterium litchii TaxID=3138810 RepID=UPI00313E4826